MGCGRLFFSRHQTKMSAPTLPYLHELLSLNDLTTRKAKALERCSSLATTNCAYGFEYLPKYKYGGSTFGGNYVGSVFGGFYRSWDEYHPHPIHAVYLRKVKCGIEFLDAARYWSSNKCCITVKELKEACKANGIKSTGNKKALISALMKI